MKKVCSILFSCALLIGMLGVVALADDALTYEYDGNSYTYTVNTNLDLRRSYHIQGTDNGLKIKDDPRFVSDKWEGWLLETDSITTTDNTYLLYDLTVVKGGVNITFRNSGKGLSLSRLIGEQNGANMLPDDENNKVKLPAGTYKGIVKLGVDTLKHVNTILDGDSEMTVADFKLVEVSNITSLTPEQPEQPTTKEIKIGYKTYTVDASKTLFKGLYTDNGDKANADENGVITIEQTGWKAWVFETSDELRDFAESEGKKMYLYYDFTVNADTNLQFTLSGWGNSAVTEIAKQAGVTPGATDEGNPTLPAGTYKGMLELTEDLFVGRTGRFGLAGTGAEIRTVEIVSVTNIKDETPSAPDTPDTPDTPDDGPDSGEAVPFAMAAAAVTAAAALAFVSRKHK